MKPFPWIALCVYVAASLIAQESSLSDVKSKYGPEHWIQTDQNEFLRFTQWHSLLQIELINDDTAICKIMEYSGSPQLKPVLTIKSKIAVSRLKEKLTKEGNWFSVTIAEGKTGYIRWNYVSRVTVLPAGNDPAQRNLKVTHITNNQPLELGLITDTKAVKELLNTLERDR